MNSIPLRSAWNVLPTFSNHTNPLDVTEFASQRDLSFHLSENANQSKSMFNSLDDFTQRPLRNIPYCNDRSELQNQHQISHDLEIPEASTMQAGFVETAGDAALAVGAFSLLFLKIPIATGLLALGRYLFGRHKPEPSQQHRSLKTISSLENYSISTSDLSTLRKKYSHLYQTPLFRKTDNSIQFHDATFFRRGNINVLHLHGDHFEMAFQHGRLMREFIDDGALRLVSEKIPRVFKSILGENSRLYGSTSWLLNQFVHREMFRHTPRMYLEEIFALSEGSGFPHHRILAALTSQEVMHVLARFAIQKVKVEAAQCASCCTSFSAWNEYSKSGGVIVGRNFDNPLNGYFDKHPTVIYFEPTDGGQKYVSITSAGVHTAGITSYNESGIFVALHTIPSRETSPSGTSALHIATEVIRQARSFDEAVEIFRQFKSPVGWAFHLVSSKEKRAATIEQTNKKISVHETSESFHVLTNHFNHKEMKNRIMYVNTSVDDDTKARYIRAQQLLESNHDGIDAKKAMTILADQIDPFLDGVRGLENTIGVHTTVGSVVMVPEEGKFYVANGMAPVQHNEFVEFPVPEKFSPTEFENENFDVVQNSEWKKSHPDMYAAVQHFIEAKKAYEFDKDNHAAFQHLKNAVVADGSNSSYFFNLGIMALKVHDTKTALSALQTILHIDYPQQNVLLAHYYLGRILAQDTVYHDLAVRHFQTVVDQPGVCTKMKAAAVKALSAVKRGQLYPLVPDKISLMMQQSDVENY